MATAKPFSRHRVLLDPPRANALAGARSRLIARLFVHPRETANGGLPRDHGPCHICVMADQPPGAQPTSDPLYRLVVSASQHRSRQFIWQIVDEHNQGKPVQESKQTFRSMEDAYNAGKGALERWREKTRRTPGSVDLARPPPAKQPSHRVHGPSGPMTSSIYSRG